MANDGNLSTSWTCSNSSAGSWLRLTWGSAQTLSSVTLRESGAHILSHRVEVLNGSTWVAVASGSTVGSAKTYSFSPVSTTAVRLFVTGTSGQPSIFEFEAF